MENGDLGHGVIQFSCEHCRISLTVDDSLAGVSGPCPSCGKPTVAPDQNARVEQAGRSGSQTAQVSSNEHLPSWEAASRERRGGRRKKRSKNRISQARDEGEEVAAVIKIMIAGFVVLSLVLGIAYFVYQRWAG